MPESEALIIPINRWPISQLLIAPNPSSLVIPQPAFIRRDELLQESANIEQVVGEASFKIAGAVLTKLSTLIREIDKDRQIAKRPVNTLARQVEKAADTFVENLLKEERRLKTLIGGFQQEVQRKAREEEEHRRAEIAEINRIQAEKDMAAATGQITPQQAAEMQQGIDAAATTVLEQPVTEVPKVSGVSATPIRKFRVTDIHALYKARPELVSLSERTADINRVIRSTPEVVEIPGIEQYDDIAVTARST